ncbi:6670_t:CDS:2 [Rhizophagus irregularis]|nr:6670_t:CDS:2 [Rhizophagus irregularis]
MTLLVALEEILLLSLQTNFKIDGYEFNALVEAIPIKNYSSNPPSPPNLPNPEI